MSVSSNKEVGKGGSIDWSGFGRHVSGWLKNHKVSICCCGISASLVVSAVAFTSLAPASIVSAMGAIGVPVFLMVIAAGGVIILVCFILYRLTTWACCSSPLAGGERDKSAGRQQSPAPCSQIDVWLQTLRSEEGVCNATCERSPEGFATEITKILNPSSSLGLFKRSALYDQLYCYSVISDLERGIRCPSRRRAIHVYGIICPYDGVSANVPQTPLAKALMSVFPYVFGPLVTQGSSKFNEVVKELAGKETSAAPRSGEGQPQVGGVVKGSGCRQDISQVCIEIKQKTSSVYLMITPFVNLPQGRGGGMVQKRASAFLSYATQFDRVLGLVKENDYSNVVYHPTEVDSTSDPQSIADGFKEAALWFQSHELPSRICVEFDVNRALSRGQIPAILQFRSSSEGSGP
jgi:hypothetical protein